MTLAPAFLVKFLASYRAARLRHRLAAGGPGVAAQQTALARLCGALARTEFGRLHGLPAGADLATFRQRVPLRRVEEFRGWIERMAGGASDVLWPGRCRHFVYTAGTVTGTPRPLPVTADLLAHYRGALADALLLHVLRTGSREIFLGRHLHLGSGTALTCAGESSAGYLDAMAWLSLSDWARENLYAPDRALADRSDSPERTAAIVQRYPTGAPVSLLAGTPAALLALAEAARGPDAEAAPLRARWPRLECAVHTGTLPLLLLDDLRAALGPGVCPHEVYAAAEGIFAAQDGEASAGLRLFTDAGLFFEFVPVRELPAGGELPPGLTCLTLAEVQTGTDYALVVTTPGGLCRCVMGDRVRFVSTTPPRLIVTGRTELQLDTCGEQIGERTLTTLLQNVCTRSDWKPVAFHVAPYALRPAPRPLHCHEWWIELRSGTVRTPTGPVLALELDEELRRRNPDYETRRLHGQIAEPIVRLVMPGTFARWAQTHAAPGGLAKLSPCRNDRRVADQLAGIARFHAGGSQPPLREPTQGG